MPAQTEAILGKSKRLWIEDSVGAGTFTLIEQDENTDSSLANDSDEFTNKDSDQRKEHKLTTQGLETTGTFVRKPAATYAASGQKKLMDAADNMTEGLLFRVINDVRQDEFNATVQYSESGPHDANIRVSFTVTRTGTSVYT